MQSSTLNTGLDQWSQTLNAASGRYAPFCTSAGNGGLLVVHRYAVFGKKFNADAERTEITDT